MRFIAKYRKTGAEYFRTVWADNPVEATKQANRYAKKGYMLISVVQAA